MEELDDFFSADDFDDLSSMADCDDLDVLFIESLEVCLVAESNTLESFDALSAFSCCCFFFRSCASSVSEDLSDACGLELLDDDEVDDG